VKKTLDYPLFPDAKKRGTKGGNRRGKNRRRSCQVKKQGKVRGREAFFCAREGQKGGERVE